MNDKPNRLIDEKSPYLLQHAYNPVDWHAWNDETFAKAEQENKPVFLSIGYSTCHWCHVMERESFEDPETAELLNRVFIPVKVDREERPDIDNIYMTVCQMMTGGGGWPLTIFMTPGKKPFFSATYIPRENRYGRAGLKQLVTRIDDLWQNRRDDIESTAEDIFGHLKNFSEKTGGEIPGNEIFEKTYEHYLNSYDKEFGGFGNAPKFPSPHNLMFLLRYWKRTGETEALDMVKNTLMKMRLGGVYDHIGLGFHRYSTDRKWFLPHFEKMLYDQAMISLAAIETYQATGRSEFKRMAEEIFQYVLRDMTDENGGFYSAEDADSEGEEGKFYVWDTEELQQILDEDEYELIEYVSDISFEGNFTEEGTGEATGKNILHMNRSLESAGEKFVDTKENIYSKLIKIRSKLFPVREKRVHPLKDDKILTDWNGLMIAALARGGAVFSNSAYVEAAEKAASFIHHNMHRDGKLLHRYREGEAAKTASADDYAFMVFGLTELYEATFNAVWLRRALEYNDVLIKNYEDKTSGGFFFTPEGENDLPVRKKESYDGAIPSGNSVSLLNLVKLSRYTGNSYYEDKAWKLVKTFSGQLKDAPSAFSYMLCGLDYITGHAREIVLVGKKNTNASRFFLSQLYKEFVPNKVMLYVHADRKDDEIFNIAEYARDYEAIQNNVTAYVCENFQCNLPVTDINQLINELHSG